MPDFDPIQGIETQTDEVKLVMIAQAIRAQSRSIAVVGEELRYVKRTLLALVFTIGGAVAAYLLTNALGA